MDLIERIKRLPEDWKRIISVAKRPEKNMFNAYLRVTLLVIIFIGILAFLIQLSLAVLLG